MKLCALKIAAVLTAALCSASSASLIGGDRHGTLSIDPEPVQVVTASWPASLAPAFQSAAASYNVPVELLLTIGYYGSAFENRGDAPTVEGGYGVMSLRKNTLGGDSLTLGAQLTGASETALKLDAVANIQAAAAVLNQYAAEAKISRDKGLEAWLKPVIRLAGLDEENSRFWAMEIFRQLQKGLDVTNSAGERFTFGPQSIGSVNLASLAPPNAQPLATTDYALAIWDPAATCNYSTSTHNNDTVVIHTAEGTAAGTRSWFKNCNHGAQGPSSSQYVVDSAGTVWQMVRENQTAWHAGCYNGRSVGIEHEGYAGASSHPQALYDGSAALTKDICDRWGIPKEKRAVGPGIIGHVDVTNCCCGTHSDPGNGWDWNYYIQQVAGTVDAEQVYVESRAPGQNSQWYSDDASWGNSAGWCGGFDTNLQAGSSRYLGSSGAHWCQVQPVLGAAGGTYKVEVSHYGLTNISSDILVSFSLTGCAGLSGTTTAFQSGQSCMWVTVGQITLNPGVTQPTIRFNLAGGTIDGNHRWNTQGFRFTLVKAPLTVVACPGGVVVGGGIFDVGEEVNVVAAAFANNCFVNWTSDGCGGNTVASRNRSYTFNMPGHALTLSANFTRGLFFEGFEGLAAGSLDMNDSAGPNKGTNGDKNGNPWFGPAPPNGAALTSGASPHSGSAKLSATSGVANCVDMVNAAYRFNSGNNFAGGVFLDWWFYDPKGAASDANTYQDYLALATYDSGTVPTGSDYGSIGSLPGASQRLSLGASADPAAGYDKTRYQARVPGAVEGYDQGWMNTPVVRVVGWHHARIVVGPPKSPSNTSDVSFFIDNMTTPALTHDSLSPVSLNTLQIVTRPNSSSNVSGYLDDLTFGRLSGTPLAVAPFVNSQTSVGWKWSSTYPPSDGFHVWDPSLNQKADVGSSTLTWTENGLSANTAYSRSVSSYFQIASSPVDSPRTQLGPVYTLANAPVYGSSGPAAVSCDKGPGNPSTVYTSGTEVTFTAVNGFGDGSSRAGSYEYVWDTSASEPAWGAATLWTSGTLSLHDSTPGSYYLHLRARNGDGIQTQATLTLGPYVFEAATAVQRIGDLWALDDDQPLTLDAKAVTVVQPDVFWLEELDRSAAVRVLWSGGGVSPGRLIKVTGSLGLSGATRALTASAVQDTGPSSAIAALWMNGAALGGASVNPATPGVSGGLSLYNIGMLVQVAGAVTFSSSAGPSDHFFYLDDGSGLSDGSGHMGVKVKCGSIAPPATGMVSVRGIVDAEISGQLTSPVILVTDAQDIIAP